jgi:Rrf2 family protein
MRVSAKVDYALRAMAELAAAPPGLMTAEQLASAQHIPPKFLESILSQLRSAGLVASQRGAVGGYQLARPAEEISIADVIRELEGPIATVRGVRPAAQRLARPAHGHARRPRADDARRHHGDAAQGLTVRILLGLAHEV